MADQHHDNTPAIGNQIADDIPDIAESLDHHKAAISNFCSAWSDTDASVIWPDTMKDADSDTMIQVEESADEDTIRFDIAGTERALISAGGLYLKNSSPLQVNVINEYDAASGVTIEGILLKDSTILANANSIKHHHSLCACGGPASTAAVAYTNLIGFKFVCPPAPDLLRFHANIYASVGAANVYARMTVTGLGAVAVTQGTTTPGWYTDTLDISSLTPGTTYEILIAGYTDNASRAMNLLGCSILFEAT